MNAPVVVVGSGASGVHFALTLLRKGHRVVMLDVGRRRPEPVNPADSFVQLKTSLADPARYFLGPRYEALILPDFNSEYYGFPPGKEYVFAPAKEFSYRASGFAPLLSFAAGGLAEAWTGGSYPFRDDELAAFPFGWREIAPFYTEVARRVGISGVEDDMARFFPVHEELMPPLDLDEHSSMLLASYGKRREAMNSRLHAYLGRARLATLTRDRDGRKACSYSGRCLWGCPTGALYTPSLTLRECLEHPNFEYLPETYVSHFRFSSSGKVSKVVAGDREIEVGTLALAAGALSSTKIFLESIYRDTGSAPVLRGLMDNRQIMMPFVNLRMLGKAFNPDTYQYHQLAIGVEGAGPAEYIHGLVTTLKTAMIHPIVQSIPFDLGTSLALFRNMHAALGLVNINFADYRREENCLALEDGRLVIHYAPASNEPQRLSAACKTFRKLLWKLDCIAPAPMTHVRPMGASVHYAGTLPMTREAAPFTCTEYGRSREFDNLYFADGTTFPFLPAKNLTFTLMANAVRIAESVCERRP